MELEQLKWHTETRLVKDLIPYKHNPRYLTDAQKTQLLASLENFDLVEIPAADLDNTLIAGHQRVMILLELGRGEEEIDVRFPNRKLTEEEFKEYNIRSNANTGSWDLKLLKENFDLEFLKDVGLDYDKAKKINNIIEKLDPFLPVDEVNEVTEPSERKALVQVGDIFEINGHRLICGDSTRAEVLQQLMDGKQAQMCFTDPPYNVKIDSIVNLGKTQHREFKMASGEMTPEEFTEFLKSSLRNIHDNVCPGAIIYVCMDWKHIYEIIIAGRDTMDEMKQLIVWSKDNGGMGTFYRSKHELIFVYKKNGEHINNFGLGEKGRYRTNVWEYAGVNSFTNRAKPNQGGTTNVGDLEYHPTVKPVLMVADAILDCSHDGHIILDIFGGSGTTLISAEQTGRLAYLVEFDEKYIEVIIRRYAAYLRQLGKEIEFKHINGHLTIQSIIDNV